jgi:hypothetical protein
MKKASAGMAAVIGVALSATGAVAAASVVSTVARDHAAVGGTNDNHGGAVSTVARDTAQPETTSPETTTPETTAGAQGAHGAAVSAVAQDQTAVGGPNDNHGGAVSAVARGTHGASAVHGKSADAQTHKPSN